MGVNMARLKECNVHYCESEHEHAFIGFLENEGWEYTLGNDLSRETKRNVLIIDDFKIFIAKTKLCKFMIMFVWLALKAIL